MKKTFLCLLGFAGALLGAARVGSHDWPERDRETIQKTLPLAGAPLRLVVDNVQGYVHVKGVTGSEVRVTAHKVIDAESDSDLAQARSDVKLEMTESPGAVSIYYAAPWRCEGKNSAGCQSHQRHFYNVTFDIDVEAPAAARLVISTVNGGDVRVDQASGNYEIGNVNGGIEMSGISGSGSVHTVNGAVSVRFASNPAAACSFKSVNGSLDAWLQQEPEADLLFKTMNGQVYSDFEVAPRAVPASVETEQHGGKFVYRSNGRTAGRIGNGGPELSFDTLNGSIRLHREE